MASPYAPASSGRTSTTAPRTYSSAGHTHDVSTGRPASTASTTTLFSPSIAPVVVGTTPPRPPPPRRPPRPPRQPRLDHHLVQPFDRPRRRRHDHHVRPLVHLPHARL